MNFTIALSAKGRQSTGGATSHPTKQPRNGCQVFGYIQQAGCGVELPLGESWIGGFKDAQNT